ncbi:uncharacterized protein LOC144707225 isoform X1 [Wolffia australiana]
MERRGRKRGAASNPSTHLVRRKLEVPLYREDGSFVSCNVFRNDPDTLEVYRQILSPQIMDFLMRDPDTVRSAVGRPPLSYSPELVAPTLASGACPEPGPSNALNGDSETPSQMPPNREMGSMELPSVQIPAPTIETTRVHETVDLTPAPPLEEAACGPCAQINGLESIPTALVTDIETKDDSIDWKSLEAALMEEDLDDIIPQSWVHDVSVPSLTGVYMALLIFFLLSSFSSSWAPLYFSSSFVFFLYAGPEDSNSQSVNIHSEGGLTDLDELLAFLDDTPCPKPFSPGNS